MDKLLLKINTAALVVIAASLAVIAYKQLQPHYLQTDKGLLDINSGQVMQKRGDEVVPVAPPNGRTEDRLRREYPDGRTY